MKSLSTKKEKRRTKQIRVSALSHFALKSIAQEVGITISSLTDRCLLQVPDIAAIIRQEKKKHKEEAGRTKELQRKRERLWDKKMKRRNNRKN